MRIRRSTLKKIIRKVIIESVHPYATREDLIQLIDDYTEDGEEQSYEMIVDEFVDYIDRPDFTEEMAASMLDDLLSEPNSPVENSGGLIQLVGGAGYDGDEGGNDYEYQEGAVGQVHFPSDIFDIQELEDYFDETPSPAKVMDRDPEYLVQGNIEELRFIWTETNSKQPGLSFDDHIIKRF